VTIKRTLARYLYVYGWRFRYLWFDTPLGPRCRLTAAALVAVFSVWHFVYRLRTFDPGQPVQAFWEQIAILVISMLISYALTPKTPDAVDQPGQAPKVEDGAGVRMVFGEVWITDPAVIGWKKIGTQTIRGKKSGFNGRPIIGYWYKQLFHFVLCRGPVDAVLEFRGGDKVAWAGELPASGDVQINKKDLWGGTGTGGEGGIEGPMAFLFGDAAQPPSTYLASALGSQQPAYRGLLTALFKGGLWGAFSPYPKAASFKVRRILQGWEREGGAWYPERAMIFMTAPPNAALYFALDLSGSMNEIASNGRSRLDNMKTAMTAVLDQIEGAVSRGSTIDCMLVGFGSSPAGRTSIVRRAASVADVAALKSWVSARSSAYGTYFPAGVMDMPDFYAASSAGAARLAFFLTDGEPADASSGMTAMQMAQAAGAIVAGVPDVRCHGINIDLANTTYTALVDNTGGDVVVVDGGKPDALVAIIRGAIFGGKIGMNPAHMLHQSITDSWMGAEPEAQMEDANFRAAADALYGEGFGLCTEWISTGESVEAFQQRICDVIGANLSRSPIDGKWHLDLIRGGYDTSSLPVLTDDDILDYTEQPGTLVDTVNQVIVEWRDPQQREDRSTAPVQSLGSIQAAGAVIGEVATYREIPDETLALRVAGRNLQSKCRPLRRINGKATRAAHAWRPGQVINLQSAKRGIASMYCRVGDIDRGTLRSGAISLTLLQDVFGLPQTVYVQPEPGADTGDDDVPKPVEASELQEVPYALLASLLPPGELEALTSDAGYLFAVATPAGAELDYNLLVDAGAGYEQQAESDWSATATNSAACGPTETSISIVDARDFDEVVIGAMVLWGSEICRMDAVDLIAGTVTLGRGCGDTVPSAHAAGERLWVIDDSIALDVTRYSTGATVAAKLLPRTASQRLDEAAAAAFPVDFASRAARPYPPAHVQLNGMTFPLFVGSDMVFTWHHRDRILQADTLVATIESSVGPEPGATYTVEIWNSDATTLVTDRVGVVGDTVTIPISEVPAPKVLVRVFSVREGLESMARWQWPMEIPLAALEFIFTDDPYTPPDGAAVDFVFES